MVDIKQDINYGKYEARYKLYGRYKARYKINGRYEAR